MIPLGVMAGAHVPASSGSADLAYVHHVGDPGAGPSYLFPSVPIGVASADRTVVVVVHSRGQSGTITGASVTIGGMPATHVGHADNGQFTGIYMANVPTGATADIAVGDAGPGSTTLRLAITVYTSPSVLAAASSATSTTNDGLPFTPASVPPGAAILAASTVYGSGATWSGGVVEQNEDVIEIITYTTALGGAEDAPSVTWSTATGPPASIAVAFTPA